MAKNFHPTAPLFPNDEPESDIESVKTESDKELLHKYSMKRLAYVAIGTVLQTLIILVFSLIVLRIKSPKFRIASITIEDLDVSSEKNFPTLGMRLNAQVTVKNTNFGDFKFEESSINFVYKGKQVGDASVDEGKVNARSTKKMNVTATGSITAKNDVEGGILRVSCHCKLKGKVHLMKMIKKKESAEMSCSFTINLKQKMIKDLKCK
ncbi:hypothetical protein UlMin_042779 [Ulmus minor]